MAVAESLDKALYEAWIGAVWGALASRRTPIESIRGQRIEEIDR